MAKRTDYLANRIKELDDDQAIELLDTVTDKVAKVQHKPKDSVIHASELSEQLQAARSSRGKFKGLSTGFTQLDAKMGGLEAGSVILVGGSTGNGKSALATNIAAKVAEHTPVFYISLEMTLAQMLDRLDAVSDNVVGLDLLFQKSFAINYKDLEPLLERARAERGVKLVVLDYLQYLGRGMTLDEVAKMSKEIKSLALRFEIAFLVIVSIRKGGADMKFRRKWTDIEIDDLMGSAAIGYDADTAVIVSRRDQENEYRDDKVYVKVLKTRNTKLDYNDPYVELEWNRMKITEAWQAIV